MKRFAFILFFLTGTCLLAAQLADPKSRTDQSCLADLKNAEISFQNGLFDKCIMILEDALKTCHFSKSEKEHALELLAKAYIETGDIDKAESVVNKMLTYFPYYELKESDNSESFNRMIKKYNVHPRFSFGARNTAIWNKFKPIKIFTVLEGLDYSQPYNHKGYGFMYYGWLEFEFDKDISINVDGLLFWTTYNRNITKAPGFNLSFWETDNYMEVPVYIKKYFHIGKNILPYITAGMGWLGMTKAVGNAEISYTKEDVITGKDADYRSVSYNINMLGMRNKSTYEWLTGIGIGYKLKYLRFFLDARYYGGLNSITNAKNRLQNSVLISDFYYVDNSVKFNQFEIGASISYTLNNSVKRIRK